MTKEFSDCEQQLLPCPFCNGRGVLHQQRIDNYIVYCHKCKIQTPTFTKYLEAFELWNKREPDEFKLSDTSYLSGLKYGKYMVRTRLFQFIDEVIYKDQQKKEDENTDG